MSQLFTNNAKGTLNAGIAAGDLSLTLSAGQGALFPNPGGSDYFLVTLFQMSGTSEVNHEIVKVTARAADVLTIVRAQEGTAARAFNALDKVELRVTAAIMTAHETKVVLLNPTAGKTLAWTQSLTLAGTDGTTHTFPTTTSVLARTDAAQTFTGNQTITGTLAVSSDFAVATNKFTVAAASGNTVVAGTLGVTSDFAVATNKFTVAAASGNTVVAGTLGVTGAVTLSSTLAVTSTITTSSTITSNADAAFVSMNRSGTGAAKYALARFMTAGVVKWQIGIDGGISDADLTMWDAAAGAYTIRFGTGAPALRSTTTGWGFGTAPSQMLHTLTASGTANYLRIAQTGVNTWDIGMAASGTSLLFTDVAGTVLTLATGGAVTTQGPVNEVADYGSTGNAANIGSTALFTATETGWYTVFYSLCVTQAATTSSTLPNMDLVHFTGDSNTSVSWRVLNSTTTNTLATATQSSFAIYVRTGTSISFSTTGYTSVGATPMQYACHVQVVRHKMV